MKLSLVLIVLVLVSACQNVGAATNGQTFTVERFSK